MKRPLHDWQCLKRYLSSTWGSFGKYSIYLSDVEYSTVRARTYDDPGPRVEIYGNGRMFSLPKVKGDAEIPVKRVRVKNPITGVVVGCAGENLINFDDGPVPLNGHRFYLHEREVKKIVRHPGFLRRKLFGAGDSVIYETLSESTA